jgi:undecaprenyl-diphosphatase
MTVLQILLVAVVQGLAELLPVSSSAHVIVAEKLMGLDPTAPAMTFFLVMLHLGTMFAVLVYFRKRWMARLRGEGARAFVEAVVIATVATGVVGLGLKELLEKVVFPRLAGAAAGMTEVEELFGFLPLIAGALFAAGVLILIAARRDKPGAGTPLDRANSAIIGVVQGLCLPFRGFSRSGATISTGLLRGLDRALAEDLSFALAVALTPAVIALELRRYLHAASGTAMTASLFAPGALGMVASFAAGLVALRWLSAWLERGRWSFFGYYCLAASGALVVLHFSGAA